MSHLSKVLGRKNDENKININDIMYIMMQKMFDNRSDGLSEKFKSSVTAAYSSLHGIKDEIFDREANAANIKYDQLVETRGRAAADSWFYDQKHQIICNLITRATAGQLQVREYLNQSEVINEIIYKLSNGIGQNVAIVGPQGSGKSYTALNLMLHLNKNTGREFNPKDIRVFCVSNVMDFFRLYNNEKLCPPMSTIIFEEAGAGVNSKNALGNINKIFARISQTWRFRQLLIIFTLPHLGDLDKTVRKQLHWQLETKRIDRKNKICWLKPFILSVNSSGDLYTKYPINSDGNQVTELRVEKLPDEYAKAYEKWASDMKSNMAIESERELKRYAEEKKIVSGALPMSETKDYKKFVELKNKGLFMKDIAMELGTSPQRISRFNKLHRVKGDEQTD